jgi:M6 family metalloprotease-like protein
MLVVACLLMGCQTSTPAPAVVPTETSAPAATPTTAPTQTPAPTPTPVLKSGTGTEPITLIIENQSTEAISIFWLDFDGVEQPYGEIDPTASFKSESFSTHAWRLKDKAGNVIAQIVDTPEKYQLYQIKADKTVAQVEYNPCKLPVAAGSNVGMGIPKMADYMPSTGTVKAVVLLVDFPDVQSTQKPEDVLALISPGAEKFYNDISYGRMTFQFAPLLKWLRLSQPSAHYAKGLNTYEGHQAFIQEAIDLAGAEADFSGAKTVIVLSNPRAQALPIGPAFGGVNGIQTNAGKLANGVTSGFDLNKWGFLWLNHEVGHNMTLPDLYAYDTKAGDQLRFTGTFGLMGDIGGKAPEYFAFERWMLGWLDDNQVVCQLTNEATTTLTAIENKDGTKAVMVPTGPTSAIVIESRRALGYDKKIVKTGALVYMVDTSIASGAGVIQVYPIKKNDPAFNKAPLAVGESLTVGKVTVTVTEATDTGDTIKVTVAQ